MVVSADTTPVQPVNVVLAPTLHVPGVPEEFESISLVSFEAHTQCGAADAMRAIRNLLIFSRLFWGQSSSPPRVYVYWEALLLVGRQGQDKKKLRVIEQKQHGSSDCFWTALPHSATGEKLQEGASLALVV